MTMIEMPINCNTCRHGDERADPACMTCQEPSGDLRNWAPSDSRPADQETAPVEPLPAVTMTLLDYFAAGALNSQIQSLSISYHHDGKYITSMPELNHCAEMAYDYAYAMLSEREKRNAT